MNPSFTQTLQSFFFKANFSALCSVRSASLRVRVTRARACQREGQPRYLHPRRACLHKPSPPSLTRARAPAVIWLNIHLVQIQSNYPRQFTGSGGFAFLITVKSSSVGRLCWPDCITAVRIFRLQRHLGARRQSRGHIITACSLNALQTAAFAWENLQ